LCFTASVCGYGVANRSKHVRTGHFSFNNTGAARYLHSFPTRRSSDLAERSALRSGGITNVTWPSPVVTDQASRTTEPDRTSAVIDRKSTRLNSSHSQISYAVFCLKKKSTGLVVWQMLSDSCHAISNEQAVRQRITFV